MKPKCRVNPINWVLPGLYSVARFLCDQSPEGPPCNVIEKLPESNAVYIIGTTLHVHPIRLRLKDELNLILLATQFRIVDEVRVQNFHLNFFLTARRAHVRIVQTYWRTVHFVLPYIKRGPWVLRDGKIERTVRITFDEFLKPAIEAWKAGLPYHRLVFDLPDYEIDLISTWINLSRVHRTHQPLCSRLVVRFRQRGGRGERFIGGAQRRRWHEIMMVLGYPFFPFGQE